MFAGKGSDPSMLDRKKCQYEKCLDTINSFPENPTDSYI